MGLKDSIKQKRHAARIAKLRGSITKEQHGLEIGPSLRPVVPKREGFQVEIVDHLSREELTEKYAGRIINIHPSLIPSFCGKGYYGLKVHEEALKRGVKVTGATVHFVDKGCDSGPIILQKAVEVLESDTPEILQKRGIRLR